MPHRPLKSYPKISLRGKIKEAGDVGRGCIFSDPLPMPLDLYDYGYV